MSASSNDEAMYESLRNLLEVLLDEAKRTPRFRKALHEALLPLIPPAEGKVAPRTARTRRRGPGLFNPIDVLVLSGESGLRSRLETLDVEQLKDIIAEQGMDTDKLAMKWRVPIKLINRIIERSIERHSKGSAFGS